MTDLMEEQIDIEDLELPSQLPVLPLKDTIVFPDSVLPLAIGQERSVRLVEDVVSGNRLIALVAVEGSRARATGLGRPLRDRRGGSRAEDDPRPRRVAPHPRPGHQPHPPARPAPGRALSRRALRRGPGRLRGVAGDAGADAERADALRAPDRARPVPARGARPGRGERRRPERALPPRGLDAAPEDRGEAAAARARRRREAPARGARDPEPRARGGRARLEDPEPGPVGDGVLPARVLPAPAAEGDPGGARRRRSGAGGDQRAPRPRERGEAPRGLAQGCRPRARAPREAPGRLGRVRRHPHLPRVDPQPAVGQGVAGQPRPEAGSEGARRGPLRPRQGQGADPRVPGRLEAEGGRPLRADPLLRRPARASARRHSGNRSRGRSGGSSCASRSAASATRRRSEATGARTSAPCPGRSSAPCGTPRRGTRSS